MKVRLPDEDTQEIWPKMTEHEREWYKLFKFATERGNVDSLRQLCDWAGNADFEKIKKEIDYERHRPSREKYTMPARKPKHSELDYGWEPTARLKVNRATVDAMQSFDYPITKTKGYY